MAKPYMIITQNLLGDVVCRRYRDTAVDAEREEQRQLNVARALLNAKVRLLTVNAKVLPEVG